MKDKEIMHIILAIATLGIIYGFNEIAEMNLKALSAIIGFSAIIIGINILSKKIVASRLDADVEHEIWQVKRFGIAIGLIGKFQNFGIGTFKISSILEMPASVKFAALCFSSTV